MAVAACASTRRSIQKRQSGADQLAGLAVDHKRALDLAVARRIPVFRNDDLELPDRSGHACAANAAAGNKMGLVNVLHDLVEALAVRIALENLGGRDARLAFVHHTGGLGRRRSNRRRQSNENGNVFHGGGVLWVSVALHALALGRDDTAACQRFTLAASSGIASRAGFMKSTVTRVVISATE